MIFIYVYIYNVSWHTSVGKISIYKFHLKPCTIEQRVPVDSILDAIMFKLL